jgi:hypothetical protein
LNRDDRIPELLSGIESVAVLSVNFRRGSMRARSQLTVLLATCLLVVLSGPPLSAQDAASAQNFLQSVYRNYSRGGPGVDVHSPKARKIFTTSLIALLHADEKTAGPGEVGVLDGDPICSCQDWSGIFDLKIILRVLNAGSAKAAVSFALFPQQDGTDQDRRSLEVSLLSQGPEWRIDDILDKSDPKAPFDLREELKKQSRSSGNRAPTKPLLP